MSTATNRKHASPSGAILPENHHFPRHGGQEDYSPGNSSDREGCQLQVVTPITKGGSSSSDPTENVSSTDTPRDATSTCTPDPKGVEQTDTLPLDDIDTKGPPFWGTLQPTPDRRTLRPVSSADTKGTQKKGTSERRTPSRFTPDHRKRWVRAYLAGRLVAITTPARDGASSLTSFLQLEVVRHV